MSSSVSVLTSGGAMLALGALMLAPTVAGCREVDCSGSASCAAPRAGIDSLDGSVADGRLTLRVMPPAQPFFLVQGSATQVPVEITRQGSGGAVVVRAVGLPDATTTPAFIAPGETKGMLDITPSPATPQGPVEIDLEAAPEAGDGPRAGAKLAAFVRGAPGTLDTTFAGTGIVPSVLNNPEGNVHAIRTTAEGKILIVARRADNRVVVARYEAAGTMDTSFGALGVVDLDSSQSGADLDVAQTGPGKDFLYVLVKAAMSGGRFFRLGPDGDADGFPLEGVVVGGSSTERSFQISALATGNALLLRTRRNDPNMNLKVERWRPDGSVDTLYGCEVYGSGASPTSGRMVVREDGSALVFAQMGSDLTFTVCDPSGRRDESVGTSPKHLVPLGTRHLSRLAGAPEGGAVFATSEVAGELRWSRISAKGVLDTSVGVNGVSDKFTYAAVVPVMAVQSDGKVLLAAVKTDESRQSVLDLARFLPNGDPDASFGTNGTAHLDFGKDRWLDVASISFDAYGRLLVGMDAHDLSDSPLLRLWP